MGGFFYRHQKVPERYQKITIMAATVPAARWEKGQFFRNAEVFVCDTGVLMLTATGPVGKSDAFSCAVFSIGVEPLKILFVIGGVEIMPTSTLRH